MKKQNDIAENIRNNILNGINNIAKVMYPYLDGNKEGYEYEEESNMEALDIKPKLNEINKISGKGSIDNFSDSLLKSKIGIIVGGAGSGKSCLAMVLGENHKYYYGEQVNIYAVGFNQEDLPNWIKVIEVEEITEIENNSLLILDEAGIGLSSRRSMSQNNVLFSNLLNIRRHKGISVIAVLQNSANIDINFIRQSSFIVFKKLDLLQRDTERKVISKIYDEIDGRFLKNYEKYGNELNYIYSEEFNGFVTSGLPSFWSESVSRSFE